jgi:hypothetical protein
MATILRFDFLGVTNLVAGHFYLQAGLLPQLSRPLRFSGIVEPSMKWHWLAIPLLSLSFAGDLLAQGFTTSDVTDRKHRDFAGKPCLETGGAAQPLASNPRIMNHIVSLDNHCVERIKVRICYHGTDDCTDVDVPPRSRKEQLIGVFPAMQQFRYDVKEQF